MKPSPILVSLDHNEAMRPRAVKIEQAVEADDRFSLGSHWELPFDLRFSIRDEDPIKGTDLCNISEEYYHIEVKDFTGDHHSDYLGSILDGHLYEQVLYARECCHKLAIVVTGDDNDVAQAVAKAVFSRGFKGKEAADKIYEYSQMVEGFESNCISMGIQVWRLKDNPYKRMLLRVRKILEGGDLTSFAPAPAEKERQTVGLSILAGKGIGPTKAAAILQKFRIELIPLVAGNCLTDCDGIGKTLAVAVANSDIQISSGNVIRPKEPKKSKAKAAKVAEVQR
jgi:hypothetical protein